MRGSNNWGNKMKKIYITFDMEWVCDEVLEYVHNLIEENHVKATITVTHRTDYLEELRKDKNIELGIHPNFNSLISGDCEWNDCDSIINKLMELIPEAVTVRSHSLTESSMILEKFTQYGIKNELNLYVPPIAGTVLHPFIGYGGIRRIPFIFEDDIALMNKKNSIDDYSVEYYLGEEFDLPRVFNFHPNHIYLNTEKIERYNETKAFYKDLSKLKKHRNSDLTCGSESFFLKLVKTAQKMGYEFECINKMI